MPTKRDREGALLLAGMFSTLAWFILATVEILTSPPLPGLFWLATIYVVVFGFQHSVRGYIKRWRL